MIEIESTQVNTIYAGDTQVIRAYAGSDLVFGSAPVVGTTWYHALNMNGRPVGTKTVVVPDNSNYTFSIGITESGINHTAALTLTNVDNTAGAAQQVSMVVNDSPFLSSATWNVGDKSGYAMLTNNRGVSFAYSDNYTISSDISNGALWTQTNKSNGHEIGQKTYFYKTGEDVTWSQGASVGDNVYTAKLIIHSLNNTAGASQTVSIYVNDELKLDHATWPVGTTGESYLWYTADYTCYIQYNYPSNYNLENNTTQQTSS